MKWLIVEDALRDRQGHWLEYVSTFVRDLQAMGDDVSVLCDRMAQGFVIEQTGAKPVLPESIWHRMGDKAGALKRYLRVPMHAVATFFAMRKFFKEFNHRGHRGHRVGVDTQREVPCNAQEICAGAFESDSLCSALSPATSYPPRAITRHLDWIFVPTVLVHHLLGWWMLVKTGSVPVGSRVLLFFPNLPIRLDNEGKPFWFGGPTT
ncbi:MAG: hypothetical protein ACKOLA_09625, partial [Spartobacteria bacterium]